MLNDILTDPRRRDRLSIVVAIVAAIIITSVMAFVLPTVDDDVTNQYLKDHNQLMEGK